MMNNAILVLILHFVPHIYSEEYSSNKPIIESDSEVILSEGVKHVLLCKGMDPVTWSTPPNGKSPLMRPFNDSNELMYPYKAELTLENVNRDFVGFYNCFEKNNPEIVSSVYVYVNGSKLAVPAKESMLTANVGETLTIPCRPTSPDINVSLYVDNRKINATFDPKYGFTLIFDDTGNHLKCHFEREGLPNKKETKFYTVHLNLPVEKPVIKEIHDYGATVFKVVNETLSLSCTTKKKGARAPVLEWHTPNLNTEGVNVNRSDSEDSWNEIIVIENVDKSDSGNYSCVASNSLGTNSTSINVVVLDPSETFINVNESELSSNEVGLIHETKSLTKVFYAYPMPEFTILKDGLVLPNNYKGKLRLFKQRFYSYMVKYEIKLTSLEDSGIFTIRASNHYDLVKDVNITLRVRADPEVELVLDDYYLQRDDYYNIICNVRGYPINEIQWTFTPECSDQCQNINLKGEKQMLNGYTAVSITRISTADSGNLTCAAKNKFGKVSSKGIQTKQFLVYEVDSGFGIVDNPHNMTKECEDDIDLHCKASKYAYSPDLVWLKDGEPVEETKNIFIKLYDTKFSYVSSLHISEAYTNLSGVYTCRNEHENLMDSIDITIRDLVFPEIVASNLEGAKDIQVYAPLHLHCSTYGVPVPEITWLLDGHQILPDGNVRIRNDGSDPSGIYMNSSLSITHVRPENSGNYECQVNNKVGSTSSKLLLNVFESAKTPLYYYIVPSFVMLALIILILYLLWRIKKEREKLRMFKYGQSNAINPALTIDEQADLLPYDEAFEFPIKKLFLGKRLGSGAFGVVYRAEARGILDAEETTVVAVKMAKKDDNGNCIKALAAELKIMVHLGKHVNIVNLLGACTKKISKNELCMIVEYCQYGNIHSYMMKHRGVFVDQFNHNTSISPIGQINQGYSGSTSGNVTNSDYYNNRSNATAFTTFNTGGSSARMKDYDHESNYNAKSDYGDIQETFLRPLTSRDLLYWSYQIANAMEYLASRKVMHGDLAARNILLADNNVVKVCDFGLSKSIMKDNIYKKESDGLLPIKWLAVECLQEKIFSIQSDIWAYGVVLWEIFSLASTPYPSINTQDIASSLLRGYRMKKPKYSNDAMYKIMLECWNADPRARPPFSDLKAHVGCLMDEADKQYILDLNEPYTEMNKIRFENEDFLGMVSSPDFCHMTSQNLYSNRLSAPRATPERENDDSEYMDPVKSPMETAIQGGEDNIFTFSPSRTIKNLVPNPADNIELMPMLNNPLQIDCEQKGAEYFNYPNENKRLKSDDSGFHTLDARTMNVDAAVSNPTYLSLVDDSEKHKTPQYVNVK